MKVKLLRHVWVFATPWTVTYQAPLSMGFSRQEYWSGLPFPSPGHLPNPEIEPGSPALQADALASEPQGIFFFKISRPHDFRWRIWVSCIYRCLEKGGLLNNYWSTTLHPNTGLKESCITCGHYFLQLKMILDKYNSMELKNHCDLQHRFIFEYEHLCRRFYIQVRELGAGGEGDDRGWDGWMASVTRWTWVWVNSGSWWWTGRPGVLQFMGSQRVKHDWVTELNWTDDLFKHAFLV